MSMSNLIKINIHFMDMKRHMLIYPFEWMGDNYKMKVIIRKSKKKNIKKINRKKSNYSKRNEVVRLENELVISEIVFGMVHD